VRFVTVALLSIAGAACAPRAATPITYDAIVLSLDTDVPSAAPSDPSSSHGDYGYTFDEDPLPPESVGQDEIRRRPERLQEGRWKCPPNSPCEIKDTLELHKEKLAPCYAMARLPAGATLAFTARLLVNHDGAVERADVRDVSVPSSDVAACLTKSLHDIPFALEVDDVRFDLTIPVRVVRGVAPAR
jgi:hypothetical protein